MYVEIGLTIFTRSSGERPRSLTSPNARHWVKTDNKVTSTALDALLPSIPTKF